MPVPVATGPVVPPDPIIGLWAIDICSSPVIGKACSKEQSEGAAGRPGGALRTRTLSSMEPQSTRLENPLDERYVRSEGRRYFCTIWHG